MTSMRFARCLTARLVCVGIALVLACGAAMGGEFEDTGAPIGADGVITKANLGVDETWPLRVERGTFVCEGDGVFISDGSKTYPLNGTAHGLMRKDPKGRQPLEDIWLVDEKTLAEVKASGGKVEVIRFDITPVLKRGVEWCRSRP